MNFQTGFIALLAALWIGAGSWYVGTNACQGTNDLAPLELKDGNLGLSSVDHFSFELSSHKMTLGPSTRAFFAEIATHLKSNDGKAIELNGLYLSEELNESSYINLGEARAASVKDLLKKLGAPKDKIKVNSQTLAINPMRNEILYDGVGLKIIESESGTVGAFDPNDEAGIQAVEYVEPMTLFGDAVLSLDNTPSMQHYIEKINAYLSEHEEAKLQIIGHTQELGSIVKNKERSRDLANRVKRFFRNAGIHYKRIDPQARGASEPILAPSNPKASDKNTRVEIRIIE